MSNSGDFFQIPTTFHSTPRPPGDPLRNSAVRGADTRVPLLNLSTVRTRMDSVQRFLSDSVNTNTLIGKHQMDMVSAEISSAIQQIIVNGAALLASSQNPNQTPNPSPVTNTVSDPKISDNLGDVEMTTSIPMKFEDDEEIINEDDFEIIELDAVELLAEHIHFCEICGKGFKRDANLRMHMRAHGNQFKTPEALAKPERCSPETNQTKKKTRFSCPYVGCNRNKLHRKFRALKSAICVKNHFKRSHCPKMYSCNRCNKKSFSVLADLKSHLKHCGESKWKCSCGTTFSRKDKLFGHVSLFEGHMPAVVVEEEEKGKGAATAVVEVEDDGDDEMGVNCTDNGFFEGLLDGFGGIEGYCFQDVLGSPNGLGTEMMNEFYNF